MVLSLNVSYSSKYISDAFVVCFVLFSLTSKLIITGFVFVSSCIFVTQIACIKHCFELHSLCKCMCLCVCLCSLILCACM